MYLVLPSDAPGWKYSAAKAAGWPSFSTSANTKDGGNVSLSPRCNIWRDRSSKVFRLHAPTAPITTYVLLTRRLLSARPLSWLRDRCLGYVMKKYQRETEKKFLSSVRGCLYGEFDLGQTSSVWPGSKNHVCLYEKWGSRDEFENPLFHSLAHTCFAPCLMRHKEKFSLLPG